MGTGPHRQGNYERPDWFYDRESYGGIITDIGSHQIHQFLVFTNSKCKNYPCTWLKILLERKTWFSRLW